MNTSGLTKKAPAKARGTSAVYAADCGFRKSSTYVLLHGAWHANWCWNKIILLLQMTGHRVIAPDLPGHGFDQTPFSDITLGLYVSCLKDIVFALPQPVTLVAHSMAGIIASQFAELFPESIQEIVYISAFIPGHETSFLDSLKDCKRTRLKLETRINLQDQALDLKKTECTRKMLFNNCSAEDALDALGRLQAEPYQPLCEPVYLSKERFGRIKKRYIVCLKDLALTVKDQYLMLQRSGCEATELDTDHSPFISAPQALIECLIKSKSHNLT